MLLQSAFDAGNYRCVSAPPFLPPDLYSVSHDRQPLWPPSCSFLTQLFADSKVCKGQLPDISRCSPLNLLIQCVLRGSSPEWHRALSLWLGLTSLADRANPHNP
jgi:hypothetical protein